ncbi:MAG: threonine aldolase family protein [Kiloniellales bacterium]
MNFCSDNVTSVAPEIAAALDEANRGAAMPYGDDEMTRRLETRMAEVFETELMVFPVATGSAANALALACLTPPYGAVYCHRESHVNLDECGAPEFFTGGAKLVALDGAHGKIAADDLEAVLARAGAGVVHHVQPAAISVTQATEAGTVYRPEHLAALAEVARRHGLGLHMDGARFANAVVALGLSPADLTWRAGVDVLSFGATKNGAMAAEAVVFFRPELAKEFAFRRKRAGHLFSKMRFLSVQLDAYLADDRWRRYAAHANAMMARLKQGLTALPGARLEHPVEANEIFITLPPAVIDGLLADGFRFYRWGDEDATLVRLMTGFDTRPEDVDALIAAARRHAAALVAAEAGGG